MWSTNGNPNLSTDFDEILHAHSYLSKEGFDAGLTPPSHPWAGGGLETLKPVGQTCSAGCKLTWAAPGTSASYLYGEKIPTLSYLGQLFYFEKNWKKF